MSPVSHRQPEPCSPTTSRSFFSNARLVLADRVIEGGWIAAEDGMIVDFGADRAPAGAEDMAGDFIIPGLIELHTDHLEAHYMPRPKVYWDPVAAVVSYDAQLASCGITTVLDSLRVWREEGVDEVGGEAAMLGGRDRDRARRRHAAGRAFPASALRGADARRGGRGDRADRLARGQAGLADGPHARAAAIPRPGEAAHLLPRQGRRIDRCAARCPVRPASRLCGAQRGGQLSRPGRARARPWPAARQPRRHHARACGAVGRRSGGHRRISDHARGGARPCTRPGSAS